MTLRTIWSLLCAAGMVLGSGIACTGGEGDSPRPTPPETEQPGGDRPEPEAPGSGGDTGTPDPDDEPQPPQMNRTIELTIGTRRYTATLADNATAEAFAALLPLELAMSELNGNEKYANLTTPLPTAVYRPGTIEAGDLLLWGDDCVVLFYETFASGYSYTRIGKVDDPSGLAEAVGRGSVTIGFSARP